MNVIINNLIIEKFENNVDLKFIESIPDLENLTFSLKSIIETSLHLQYQIEIIMRDDLVIRLSRGRVFDPRMNQNYLDHNHVCGVEY